MKNPWTSKNPFMSLWLSTANRAASSARGTAAAQAKRNVAEVQRDATRLMLDFWSGKSGAAAKKKPRSR